MGGRWVTDNQYQPSHGSSLESGFQQQQGIRCFHHWPAYSTQKTKQSVVKHDDVEED
jgi:hypothetical protein